MNRTQNSLQFSQIFPDLVNFNHSIGYSDWPCCCRLSYSWAQQWALAHIPFGTGTNWPHFPPIGPLNPPHKCIGNCCINSGRVACFSNTLPNQFRRWPLLAGPSLPIRQPPCAASTQRAVAQPNPGPALLADLLGIAFVYANTGTHSAPIAAFPRQCR